jgi:putative membrane-bound dehydrogenase-like protein
MPRLFSSLFLAFIFLAAVAIALPAQEVIPHHQDQPPGPALSPQQAIAKMTVPEGFSVELVASEPDIVNPVAMTFDERGRTWITESLEYPRKAPGPGRDRVKILEDTDGDGRADKFTVFAEGLNIPSGIAVGYGGVWVANSPDILFYPDADRDGKPDGPPQTVVTGFGRSDTHELPNSLTWGPDGYLYGLNGVFNHSHVKYANENPNYKADHPGWQFTCALFRIHPVTREFEIFCEGTSNPWGLAFDPEGSAFVSACVIDHLWHLVRTGYYHRQGGPYPPFTWKIESIVKHKHQKAAYCGLTYFDSDAYPEQYRHKLYMGNIHGGCINVDKLARDGSTYFATPEPDFLTANDAWFMPVAQKTGPDGCLYILDWYDRYHCYQDANRDPAGLDRLKGRLYRVRYKDTPRAGKFDLAGESDERLFERLVGGNGSMRDLAHRLLIERRVAQLGKRAHSVDRVAERVIYDPNESRDARLPGAMVALALRKPDGDLLSRLLKHPEARFRAWAVRSVGNLGGTEDEWRHVERLASDPISDVTLQVAIAVGTSRASAPMTIPTLVHVLARSGNDQLIPRVVWQNLNPLLDDNVDRFIAEISKSYTAEDRGADTIVPRAMERMLARRQFDVAQVVRLFDVVSIRGSSAADCLKLLAARVQSGELRGERLDQLRSELTWRLKPALDRAATDPTLGVSLIDEAAILSVSWNDSRGKERVRRIFAGSGEPASRLRALAALVAAGDTTVLDVVASEICKPSTSHDLAGQMLAMLGRLDDARVASMLLKTYPTIAAELQPKAIELLTQRAIWAKPLVEAIGANKIPATALNVNQVQRLLALKDPELTAAVNKHWGTIRTTRDPAREKFVTEMRSLVRSTKGDPHLGIEVFNRVCGQCHKIHGQGQDVGPDITANGRSSFEQLLSNVFDPSLVIGASYQARTVLATDGRILTGLLVEDSPQRIVLKVQGGKLETLPRTDIDALKISELSLMPEGLEKQLKPQEIADLFAFLTLDKHPDDPTARPIPSGNQGK